MVFKTFLLEKTIISANENRVICPHFWNWVNKILKEQPLYYTEAEANKIESCYRDLALTLVLKLNQQEIITKDDQYYHDMEKKEIFTLLSIFVHFYPNKIEEISKP